MITSVLIGGYHMQDDFNLIMKSYEIKSPEPKINTIDVPLRDGSLDITETLTGRVLYKNRKIIMKFYALNGISQSIYTEIASLIHGKVFRVIFDDDRAFHYYGRVTISDWAVVKQLGELTITVDAEPYKMDNQSTAYDWYWDIFDFELGIINELKGIAVDGEKEVILYGREKLVFPTITVSNDMTVTYDGVDYPLKKGDNKIYDMFLGRGENELKFTGNGTVTIDYIGGTL